MISTACYMSYADFQVTHEAWSLWIYLLRNVSRRELFSRANRHSKCQVLESNSSFESMWRKINFPFQLPRALLISEQRARFCCLLKKHYESHHKSLRRSTYEALNASRIASIKMNNFRFSSRQFSAACFMLSWRTFMACLRLITNQQQPTDRKNMR